MVTCQLSFAYMRSCLTAKVSCVNMGQGVVEDAILPVTRLVETTFAVRLPFDMKETMA